MTQLNEFPGYEECELIDARKVNAYLELTTDPTDLKTLVLDSSWGESKLDFTPITQATETQTYLKLSPTAAPTYLEYDGESGVPQCIAGNDLARIIPMSKLKDVEQTQVVNGDVYMYDTNNDLFKPFNLQNYMNTTDARITALEAKVTALEATVSNLESTVNQMLTTLADHTTRITNIETRLTPPAGAPNQVVFGDINLYSDYTNSNSRAHGLFSHSTADTLANDEYFA